MRVVRCETLEKYAKSGILNILIPIYFLPVSFFGINFVTNAVELTFSDSKTVVAVNTPLLILTSLYSILFVCLHFRYSSNVVANTYAHYEITPNDVIGDEKKNSLLIYLKINS